MNKPLTKVERAILLLIDNGYAVHRVNVTPERPYATQVLGGGEPGWTTSSERGACSVKEFCAQHSIGRSMFYRMVHDGTAPKLTRVGRRVLITREAAEAWRKQ